MLDVPLNTEKFCRVHVQVIRLQTHASCCSTLALCSWWRVLHVTMRLTQTVPTCNNCAQRLLLYVWHMSDVEQQSKCTGQ